MKRYVCLLLYLLFILVGCSRQSNDNDKETTTISTSMPIVTTTLTNPLTTTTTTIQSIYPKPAYHDQIMAQDFTAIAGKYENCDGDTIVINEFGLRGDIEDDSTYIGNVSYNLDGFYTVSLYAKGEEGGWMMMIFPEGIQSAYIQTETSKIRIAFGQDFPSLKEEVYYKIEE